MLILAAFFGIEWIHAAAHGTDSVDVRNDASNGAANMNTTNEMKRTAAEAYAAYKHDIARLIDVLHMELDKHAERFNADQTNWGFAGVLTTIRNALIEQVETLSGHDRAMIENFLAE
jgi:phosphoglycerate dehydrogenase-like enzyme